MFTSIEHIEELRTVMLPKVRDFSNKVEDLMASNDEMRAVVRNFDELISIKADRTNL